MTKTNVGQYLAHGTIAVLLLTSTAASADVFLGPIAVPYYAGPVAGPSPAPPMQSFTFVGQPLPPNDGERPHELPPSFPPSSIAVPYYAGPVAGPPPAPPTQSFTFVEQPLPPNDEKPDEPPHSFPPPSGDPIPNGPMIPAVPEPSTWIMMIIGFCGMAGITQRRRSRNGHFARLEFVK